MFEGDPRLICAIHKERSTQIERIVPISAVMDSDGQFSLKLSDRDTIVQGSSELSGLTDDTEYQVSPGAAVVGSKNYDYFLESVNFTVMPDTAAAEGYCEVRYYTELGTHVKILRFYHKAGDSTFPCNASYQFYSLPVAVVGEYPMMIIYVKNVTGVVSFIYSRRRRLV